jgi:hypothetical protein
MRVFYDNDGNITSTAIVGWNLLQTTDDWIDVDDSEEATIASKKVNTATLVLEDNPTFDAEQLAAAKTSAKVKIDEMAGIARSMVITIAPGQELTYQEKSEQAADYVAAGYPADTSSYPFVQAEIEATGKTKEQAADDILVKKSEWIAVGSTIEMHRIGGKVQVDAATTPEEVQQIVDDLAALLVGV